MKKGTAIAIWFYARLLDLYPRTLTAEFQDEMIVVFANMLSEAAGQGTVAQIKVCLRELRDFPPNLLRAHLKERTLIKLIQFLPVSNSLRLALGFGMAGLFSELLSMLILPSWQTPEIFGGLQVAYFDLFQTEHGIEIVSWLYHVFNSLLAGLMLGSLFAILFAERSQWFRYLLAGVFGWFLHRAGAEIFLYSANLDFYLSPQQWNYFTQARLILAGTFLGLTFVIARSGKRGTIYLLSVASILYPLLAFFYTWLLFKLDLYTSPVLFIALSGLVAVYVASAFLLAVRAADNRKQLWLVVAGAIGYPVMIHVGSVLVPRLYLPVSPFEVSWPNIFSIALGQAVYGLLIGILFGVILGIQKNTARLQSP